MTSQLIKNGDCPSCFKWDASPFPDGKAREKRTAQRCQDHSTEQGEAYT